MTTSIGWQVWPDPSARERWCWCAMANGESRNGTAADQRVARALATRAFDQLQVPAVPRQRALRLVDTNVDGAA